MLREIKNVRQIQGEPPRRWFNNHDMDLITWHEKNKLISFQLCYDKENDEKALDWNASAGLEHRKVDDGESRKGHYKATPILIDNGRYDIEKIRNDFLQYSEQIEPEIREFVLHCLSAD